jgi:hypothetical protein
MAVPTPVMAKARIGHFAEAQVLRAPHAATWANVGACVPMVGPSAPEGACGQAPRPIPTGGLTHQDIAVILESAVFVVSVRP